MPGNGNCTPGTYTGTFMCGFLVNGVPDGSAPYMVSGPISITLQKSMQGEFLEISDGSLVAVAQGIFGIRAKLQGKLDCSTLMLTAMATDGMWAIGDPNMPLLPGGPFDGTLAGALDPQSGEIQGQWTLASGAAGLTLPGTCPGTWSVTLMP